MLRLSQMLDREIPTLPMGLGKEELLFLLCYNYEIFDVAEEEPLAGGRHDYVIL